MLSSRHFKLALVSMSYSVVINSTYVQAQQPISNTSNNWRFGSPIKNNSKSEGLTSLFGSSVAMDKDQALTDVIVYNPITKSATTYVKGYELRDNNWTITSMLPIPLKSEGTAIDALNIKIAMSGDKAIVATNKGLFSLNRYDGIWKRGPNILYEDAIAYSIAINGNHLLAAETIKDQKHGSITILRAYECINEQWGDLGLDQSYLKRISSISIQNDMTAVGISNAKKSDSDDVGAVKLFKFDGAQWHKSTTIRAGAYETSFGERVVLHDNSLFASFVDKVSTSGGLHIFDLNDNKIKSSQIIGSEGNSANFAHSFAVSGNRLLIGDEGKSIKSYIYQGAIYSYQLSSFDGLKQWKWDQTILNNPANSYQKLGINIALSGDYALAGINTTNANNDASLLTLFHN